MSKFATLQLPQNLNHPSGEECETMHQALKVNDLNLDPIRLDGTAGCDERIRHDLELYSVVVVIPTQDVPDGVTPEDVTGMCTDYFSQDAAAFVPDTHAEEYYQRGYTPPYKEYAVVRPEYDEFWQSVASDSRPNLSDGTRADAKARFFARYSDEVEDGASSLVVPARFDDVWVKNSRAWSAHVLNAIREVKRSYARAHGVDPDVFTASMRGGHRSFAPTGTDLTQHAPGDILAEPHVVLNDMTGHGPATTGELIIWTSNGKCYRIRPMPRGALLIQAGLVMERLTGGRVKAGWHMVRFPPADILLSARVDKARSAGSKVIRTTTTVFQDADPAAVIAPVPGLPWGRTALDVYPRVMYRDHVAFEVERILGASARAAET